MKYGFVYIWFDRKHKRYYIGCHWGTVDDGYICSSNWMRDAYKRRPNDFKRRILVTNIQCRNQLLLEEHKWLLMIKEEEIGNRYYNLRKHLWGHWTTDKNTLLTVGEKISLSHNRPEMKKLFSEQKIGDKNPMKRPEVAKKAGDSKKGMKAWNKGLTKDNNVSIRIRGEKHSLRMKGITPWNKGLKMNSQFKEKISNSGKGKFWYWNPDTLEETTLYKEDIIPYGFIKGRKPVSEKTRLKQSLNTTNYFKRIKESIL